ncbi:MAG: DegV family protein [Lachnospiraceae bacterium]|nr:DegV family protein [Lachnospiraceae bacterium]
MSKVAIMTDSNSGITQQEAKELGVSVLPMPFYIGEDLFFEDISLTQEAFYEKLEGDAEIHTSQPSPGDILNLWEDLLEQYDEIVHIPMSSGLSGSCETAAMLAQDFDGRVQVVNNQRISVTQRQSVLEAKALAEQGKTAKEIKHILELHKMDSSIYIMVDTLKYLKKGGRVTPAGAALGTLLRIKPVLEIQGEKLDAFAKARSVKQAKAIMVNAILKDIQTRFGGDASPEQIKIMMAHTMNEEEIKRWRQELAEVFPGHEILINPLSLSVACHIGPGSLAITCCKHLPELQV